MDNSIIAESRKARKKSLLGFFFSKKIIIFLVLLAIIGGGFYYFIFNKKKTVQVIKEPKEWTVKRDDLQIAVESDGKVTAKDGVELSFSVSGDTLEVTQVYVKEGDKIKKGDKVAAVKTDDLQYASNKAYASYQATLASYNESLSGATDKQIADSQASLEQAKISLEQAKISLDKTKTSDEEKIRLAQQAVKNANEELVKNQNELSSEDVKSAYEDLVDTIKSVYISLGDILADSDKVLGADDKSINNDFENLLGVKDYSSLGTANDSYVKTKGEVSKLDALAAGLSLNSPYSDIDKASKQANTALESFEKHLYDMQKLLEATIISSNFTQTELDSFKSNVNSNRTSINSKITSLNNSIKSVKDAKDKLDDYVTAYNNAVLDLENAKKSLEQDLTNGKTSIRVKEIAIEQAESNLKELKAPLTESELASLRSSLTSASISFDQARNNLEKSTLTSPIDGEVAALNYKAGDIIITADNTPVVSIINNNTLFIEANIEESDINKIKVGQKAYATFDAADSLKLEGEVSFISLISEASNNGVVTYPVKIVFQNTEDGQIREGMTVSVSFVTAGVSDVLIVPLNSVKNVSGKSSVESVSGEWLPVVTGFTDGSEYVEIISGLNEGDKILY
jgi:HlyD family secretion protein